MIVFLENKVGIVFVFYSVKLVEVVVELVK